MPIIQGQKMACEPCIRGHRSTKCTHAKERLMVPVRKPGRPLSSCPHPPGKPCGCGGVTAAIPRLQKCGCGTDEKLESPAGATPVSEAPSTKGSMSPTRRTFQVQKPGPKANSRKQSFDVANLGRAAPSTYTIHAPPTYGGIHSRTVSGDSGVSVSLLSTPSPLDYVQPLPPNPFSQSPVAVYGGAMEYPLQSQLATPRNAISSPVDAEIPQLAPSGVTNGNGYFNGITTSSNGVGHGPAVTVNGPAPATPSMPSTPAQGSCCSGRSSAVTAASSQQYHPPAASNGGGGGLGLHPMSTVSSPAVGSFEHPIPESPYFGQSATDPTIYTYPPFYGTYAHPILPPEWRQSLSTPTLGYGLPPGTGHLGSQHGVAFGVGEGVTNVAHSSLSHQCTCGSSCNCLGCPAHPYNEATKDYVRSAVSSQQRDEHASAGAAAMDPIMNTSATGSQADASSPTQVQTPSEASGISEDQTPLPETDFLFVTYPFGCEGEEASCLCGDDCQCVGCMIHHNDRKNGAS